MLSKGIKLGAVGGKIRWKTDSTTTAMSVVMEKEENISRSGYIDYQHNDSFSGSRWTTRETFQFMYGRPWKEVSDFYLDLVGRGCGYPSLSAALFPPPEKPNSPNVNENMRECEDSNFMVLPSEGRVGRWGRTTFKIILSYHGGSFDGWQKQPGLNTVQGLVEKALGKFVDERKAQQLSANSLPLEGCSTVAGRTDKGVTALQQVCSFYTWRKDVKCIDIEDAINNTATGMLKAIFVSEVSRVFHPNFSAKWRHYFYIFPLNGGDPDKIDSSQLDGTNTAAAADDKHMRRQCEVDEDVSWSACSNGNVDLDTEMKPGSFSVRKVNILLCQLEGKSLSYRMFARDTKASRSTGPPTECFMFHARAVETSLPCASQVRSPKVMCVELVANRFLRKMVRVLVATAVREAAAGADDDALLNLMDATCRRATAPPAPPDGLCLLDVGYDEFNRENCLIL